MTPRLHSPSRPFLSLLLPALLGVTLTRPAEAQATAPAPPPVRVAIAGLVHGHIAGFLHEIPKHPAVELVGIYEPDPALAAQYEDKFHLAHSLFYSDLNKLLRTQHPAAVLVYTSIAGHRRVIEQAAKYGASSMVEKPLATTMEDALAIRRIAWEKHVNVLVNYETTWYASNRAAYNDVREGKVGEVRRVVVHDGHEGPAEIGVGPEFLGWLTDPAQNGAGALFDFGCYGADLMTWLMQGETPLSVTAVTHTNKPKLYPRVDDEATVVLQYPGAQAVLQASWNWPFARKDIEIYGATGYVDTVAADGIRLRTAGQKDEMVSKAPALAAPEDDSLDYLVGVLRGAIQPKGDLTALDTNMVVMQILTAASESARTGRTVELKPLP